MGDPERPLLWVAKSVDKLAATLTEMGHPITADTVAKELVKLGFSRQHNRKADEGSRHPDRNAQFEHINILGLPAVGGGGWSARCLLPNVAIRLWLDPPEFEFHGISARGLSPVEYDNVWRSALSHGRDWIVPSMGPFRDQCRGPRIVSPKSPVGIAIWDPLRWTPPRICGPSASLIARSL